MYFSFLKVIKALSIAFFYALKRISNHILKVEKIFFCKQRKILSAYYAKLYQDFRKLTNWA